MARRHELKCRHPPAPLELLPSFSVLPGMEKGMGKIPVGIDKFLVLGEGMTQILSCLFNPPLTVANKTEIVHRLHVCRIKPEHDQEFLGCFIKAPGITQASAKIVVCIRILRTKGDGFPQDIFRTDEIAVLPEAVSERVVCLREERPRCREMPAKGDRFPVVPLLVPRDRKQVFRLPVIRVGMKHRAIPLLCLPDLPMFVKSNCM
jgi:hypothetical protein